MCGIAGILNPRQSRSDLSALAVKMGAAIHHRGPDSHGIYSTEGLAIVHQRLAILDLSPSGHQPMTSANGRYVIVLNGEIYNFQALKKELDYPFRGTSDTEVLLALIQNIGLEKSLKKISGMFALAVWDKEEKTLFLARDRLGEKPLYYGRHGDSFVFGSELKALRADSSWAPTLNKNALSLYLEYSYVPDPLSIYEGIDKLPPGAFLTYKAETSEQKIQHYWSLEDQLNRPYPENIARALKNTIQTVIREQMISDVPLGAFLSGGIDSSLVTALMTRESDKKVKTFSIGFRESGYDESPYAQKVAAALGTEHTELFVSEADALDLVPNIPSIYDEPFADSSQIPAYFLAHLARKYVTVALSGDGGDEMFAGYNRYLYGPTLWKKMRLIPAPLRAAFAAALSAIPENLVGILLRALTSHPQPLDKYHKVLRLLGEKDFGGAYKALATTGIEPQVLLNHKATMQSIAHNHDQVLFQQINDIKTYLPGDILVKVDRAAMASSLETRIPFLDHRVVELALRLPPEQKISRTTKEMKIFLREWLSEFIPAKEFQRPKTGFAVPIGLWLRGRLKNWAGDLLSPDHLRAQGLLDPAEVQKMWREHQSQTKDHAHKLWTITMLQAWLAKSSR